VTLKDGKLAFDVTEAALPALPRPESEGDDPAGEKLPEEVQ
jgi:ATP-dependent Clp protease ATP-binding subunit ClpA